MMSKRRTLVGLIIGASLLVVVISLTVIKVKTAEENEEMDTDVAVHVGKVVRATLHRYVTAYGTVEPEPASDGKLPASAFIGSSISGILVQINCTEGRKVSQGDILFRLDSRVAEVALLEAQKKLKFAEQTYDRQKKLLAGDGTSLKSFQEAESRLNTARSELSAAQTQLSLHRIAAPLTGTLVKLNAELGQSVESNSTLAEIIDLGRLVVAADVPSREASLLKLGQPVELGPEVSAKGSLTFISKKIDAKTDTIAIRATIPTTIEFYPGRFLNIRIICGEHSDCLAVPEQSLVSSKEEGSWIMIVRGEKAVRFPVQDGFGERGLVEVSGEGLTEGMIIVTEEAYSLPSMTKIHIIDR
jgi:membrane fusion protein (multidrug efflux system)